MHPRLTELLAYLDDQRAALERTVTALPATHLDRVPATGGWTAFQILEHLVRVERGVAALVGRAAAEGRDRGLGPETDASPLLPTLAPRLAVVAERTTRVEAPPTVQPRPVGEGPDDLAASLLGLAASRARLRATLAEVDGLALGELSAPHPFFGLLSLYAWIGFIGAHEARHAAQIGELAATLAAEDAGRVAAHAG